MQSSGIGRYKAGGEATTCHQESQALVVNLDALPPALSRVALAPRQAARFYQ